MDLQLFAITLFAPDIQGVKVFYSKAFAVEPVFEDEVSAVFKFGGTLINVLSHAEGHSLIAPAKVADNPHHHKSMITIQVGDADAEATRLQAAGIVLNYPPVNQPWGIRAFTFADPTGQLWELSQQL